jgi:hypothetical protein
MFVIFVGSFMVAVVVSRFVIISVLDYVYDAFGFTFPFRIDGVLVLGVFVLMTLGLLGSTYVVHKQVANQPLSRLLKKV